MTKHELLVLNPNSTAWMTERVKATLQHHLGEDFELHPFTADEGPPVIDSPATFEQGARLIGQVCKRALRQHPAIRGVLLACFGDPGLENLRALCGDRPVVGLADCAMAEASARHGRFAILTCGPDWVGLLERRAAELGHAEALVGVWALPVNGRELALQPQRWQSALQAAADDAQRRGAQALILGGAAFAGLSLDIVSALPQVDPLLVAAQALQR
jgi:allantoin racemase